MALLPCPNSGKIVRSQIMHTDAQSLGPGSEDHYLLGRLIAIVDALELAINKGDMDRAKWLVEIYGKGF